MFTGIKLSSLWLKNNYDNNCNIFCRKHYENVENKKNYFVNVVRKLHDYQR